MRRTPGVTRGRAAAPCCIAGDGGRPAPVDGSAAAALSDAADRWAAPDRPRAEFRLLGHLEVGDGDGAQAFGGPKQRALLAFLLLHAGEVVTTERLVDAIWGDEPPPTATAIVYGYVRKLRSALEATSATLSTRSAGLRPRHPGRLARRGAVRAPGRARPAGPPGRRRDGRPPAARRGARPVARPGPRRPRRRRVHPRRAVAPRVAPPRDDAGPDRRRPAARRRGRGRGRAGGARPRAPARRGHPRPADGGPLPHRQPGGGARGVPGHPSGARGGAGPRPVAQPAGARGRDPAPGSVAGRCRIRRCRTPVGPGRRGRRRRPSASSRPRTPARSSASRPSASTMRTSSSGASAWCPRWSRASPSTRSSGSSARRAAASRRRSEPASCPRSRRAPSATTSWVRVILRPGAEPMRELDRVVFAALDESQRSRLPAGQDPLVAAASVLPEGTRLLRDRRPVRGGVHERRRRRGPVGVHRVAGRAPRCRGPPRSCSPCAPTSTAGVRKSAALAERLARARCSWGRWAARSTAR